MVVVEASEDDGWSKGMGGSVEENKEVRDRKTGGQVLSIGDIFKKRKTKLGLRGMRGDNF